MILKNANLKIVGLAPQRSTFHDDNATTYSIEIPHNQDLSRINF